MAQAFTFKFLQEVVPMGGWIVRLIDWLIDWFIDWLIDWLIYLFIYLFLCLFIYLFNDRLIEIVCSDAVGDSEVVVIEGSQWCCWWCGCHGYSTSDALCHGVHTRLCTLTHFISFCLSFSLVAGCNVHFLHQPVWLRLAFGWGQSRQQWCTSAHVGIVTQ